MAVLEVRVSARLVPVQGPESGGCMSDGTVRRYWVSGSAKMYEAASAADDPCGCNTPCRLVVFASDYDTLRTQARTLAEVTLKDRAEACPFVEGSTGAQVWMASDTGAQLAQAVLDATKEGA